MLDLNLLIKLAASRSSAFPPNPGDHQHVTVQFTDVMISSGEVLARGTYFDNGGVTASRDASA
jgi:hypothetical protein